MRSAIIADLHANLEALQAVLKEIDGRGVDAIYCLGDLTGYNANPNEVIDIIRERRIPTLMGNHDAAICGIEDPWFFRASAKIAVQWQSEVLREDNRRWLAAVPEHLPIYDSCLGVHGSPASRDEYIVDWLDAMRQLEFLNGRGITLCFFGHSHRASFFSEHGAILAGTPGPGMFQIERGNRYFINPGALGQPRDADPRAAFGIFDTDSLTFEFCRVDYDIETCMRRVIQAGLPKELAYRLRAGK